MDYKNFKKIFDKVNREQRTITREEFDRIRTFYGNISDSDAYSIAMEIKNKNEWVVI